MTAFPSSAPSASSRVLYFRLLAYVRPYWKMLLLGLLLSALAAAMEPFLPALMKPLLDNGFAPPQGAHSQGVEASSHVLRSTPWLVPLMIVGVLFLRGIITFCASYAMAWVQNRLIRDLRQVMFEHLTQLPTAYFEATPSARTTTRFTHDVNNVASAATTVGTVIVRESLTLLGLLAWLFYLNWQLTLITLLVAPFIAYATRAVGRRLRSLGRAALTNVGTMTQTVQEAIHCQKVLRVFAGEAQEAARFSKINETMRGYAMREAVAAAAGSPMVHVLVSFAIAAVVYIALLQSAEGQTTVGSFVSFITAMLMLLAPLRALAGVNAPLQRGLAGAESVFLLLDTPVEPDKGSFVLQKAVGRIELVGLHFRYPLADQDALSGLDLLIMPGQTVALVGPSGGGKTTLASLLPRFYCPTQGKIYLDGIDIETLSLASLRAQISIVSQETLLFNTSVAANIAYGAKRAVSESELSAAAEAAHALDFIRALPEGFETMIGEGGNRLSGGQRQRLAIARAILKDAPILILDEATSALDNESEWLVQSALERLMAQRTTLVIAHRLSTIERADRIVFLQQGKIAETGTHAELIAANGLYARLHRGQLLEKNR